MTLILVKHRLSSTWHPARFEQCRVTIVRGHASHDPLMIDVSLALGDYCEMKKKKEMTTVPFFIRSHLSRDELFANVTLINSFYRFSFHASGKNPTYISHVICLSIIFISWNWNPFENSVFSKIVILILLF